MKLIKSVTSIIDEAIKLFLSVIFALIYTLTAFAFFPFYVLLIMMWFGLLLYLYKDHKRIKEVKYLNVVMRHIKDYKRKMANLITGGGL